GQIPKVVPGAPSGYIDYRWDYSIVLNADTVDEIVINPYDAFIGTTPSGNSYWTVGSLGIIEFIGRYENSADNEVVVPFRQDVELFVPPIPVIEIKGQSDAEGETLIFCESQAQIDITAFPSPSAGRSTGSFALYDSATSLPIPIPVGGFTDFGDGNAALFPAVLTNNY